MRGAKLVISTLIVIFIFSLSCYAALAIDSYGPKDTKGTSKNGPILFSAGPTGIDIAVAHVMSSSNNPNPTDVYTCTNGNCVGPQSLNPGTGMMPHTMTPDATTSFVSVDPTCDPALLPTDLASYQSWLISLESQGCLVGDIVGIVEIFSDGKGFAEYNMFAGTEFTIGGILVDGWSTPGSGCTFNGVTWDCTNDEAHLTAQIDLLSTPFATLAATSVYAIYDANLNSNCYEPLYPVDMLIDPTNTDTTFTAFGAGDPAVAFTSNPIAGDTFYPGVQVPCDWSHDAFGTPFMTFDISFDGITTSSITAAYGVGTNTYSSDIVFSAGGASSSNIAAVPIVVETYESKTTAEPITVSPDEPFVYVIPVDDTTEVTVTNIDIITAPNNSITVECYNDDCIQTTPTTNYSFEMLPGNSSIPFLAYALCGGTGSLVIKSSVSELGIRVMETDGGIAGYNIYGGRGDDSMDSEFWGTVPEGDYNAYMYVINPNSYPVSSTIEFFRRGAHIGVKGVDVEPYCVETVEIEDLDENFPTVIKTSFTQQGTAVEGSGNAVLMVKGNSLTAQADGLASLEFISRSGKELPPDFAFDFPFFGNACFVSTGFMPILGETSDLPLEPVVTIPGYYKTTIIYFDNNANVNKDEIDVYTTPTNMVLNGPNQEILGTFLVEPFSKLKLPPSALDVPPSYCGTLSIEGTVPSDYVMVPGATDGLADVMIMETSSDGGFGLSWASPSRDVILFPFEAKDVEEPVYQEPVEVVEEVEEPEYQTPVEENVEREYGITGQVTRDVKTGKTNAVLGIIVLAGLVGILLFLSKGVKRGK